MGSENEYPSPREALFGNGHVANLRCAIKYFVWQFGHALYAVLLVPFVLIGSLLPEVTDGSRLDSAIETGKTVGEYGMLGLAAISIVFGIAVILYMLILSPLYTIGMFVLGAVSIALAFGLFVVGSTVSDTAPDKPGLRRVYGYCPVSMDMKPKWFDRIYGDD